jgi:predicted MFS family arabinose efflux permease
MARRTGSGQDGTQDPMGPEPGGGAATRSVSSVPANRWVILAGYGLLAACTQLLWLSYASITAQAHRAMGVSEGAVGDLAAIFPLMYVILALPSGRWLDARFARALSAGAVLTGAGALLRLAGPESFGWALAGQFLIAAGQPLVLNSITKVAARYFPPPERTAAISVGSVALFAGVLAAVLSAGPLLDAGGLRLLVWTQAALTLIAVVWVMVAVRTPAAFTGDPSVAVSLGWLRGDRFMWLLGGLLFVGIGVFNAVATWLDSILGHFGRGGAAGYLIAIMTAAGILGAAVLPQAVATRDRRRTLLQTAVSVTVLAFAAIALLHNVVFVGCVLFVEGFFLLAALPVVLDWSELHAGPERAGAAVGFLLLAGNLGGVVLVLILQGLIGNPYASLGALSVAALAGAVLAARLPARTAGAVLPRSP